jgi:hypothetical protein
LSSVLFPTFGLPTSATVPARVLTAGTAGLFFEAIVAG